MPLYDYIIAGTGGAGLSLALQFIRSNLKNRSILLIDRDIKEKNDRTWCFWAIPPTPLDGILYRSWDRIQFIGENYQRELPLGSFRYNLIQSKDFYQSAFLELAKFPNVQFLQGAIQKIEDTTSGARVIVDNQVFDTRYVFDSLFSPGLFNPDRTQYHYLKQHFAGWKLETSLPVFNPGAPVLFDFRTPQNGAMRFFYVLPLSPTCALVEYTLFSPDLLKDDEYQSALKIYTHQVLELDSYNILEMEKGIIPMTDFPFPRRTGQHILNIGTKGGLVKPSTGYAFWRMNLDAQAIVDSLVSHGHPFNLPQSPARYKMFDSILLNIMLRQPNKCAMIFTQLFRNNSADSIFRFLDESGEFRNDLKILSSVPPWPFIQAWLRLKLFKKL